MRIIYLKGRGMYNNWVQLDLGSSHDIYFLCSPPEPFLCSQLFFPSASSLSPKEAQLGHQPKLCCLVPGKGSGGHS